MSIRNSNGIGIGRLGASIKGSALTEYGMSVGIIVAVTLTAVTQMKDQIKSIFGEAVIQADQGRSSVAPPPSTRLEWITQASLGSVPFEVPFDQRLRGTVSSGQLSYSLRPGSPSWLSIGEVTGVLSEVGPRPVILREVSFTARITDSAGKTIDRAFTANLRLPHHCNAIYQASPTNAVDGVYEIAPDGDDASSLFAFCDMVPSGALKGGWTAVVRQMEEAPVKDWGDGLAGLDDAGYMSRSFTAAQNEIPQHSQMSFGRQTASGTIGIIDAIDFVYTAGNINAVYPGGNIPGILNPSKGYDVHRNTSEYYSFQDPDFQGLPSDIFTSNFRWFDTLTIDERETVPSGQPEFTWSFAPNHPTRQQRGFAFDGTRYTSSQDDFAWMVFVK